jgi:outer membrane receptor for ferrienterochelin and colicin
MRPDITVHLLKQAGKTILLWFFFAALMQAQEANQLTPDLSLDSLLNIKINTATKYEQTAREAPASVTIITSGEIRQFGYRTLDDVLSHVRGFYTSYDRNYSYVGARGFSRPTDYNDRLLVLLDGHTLNENFSGGASIGTDFPIAMESIDRIEIVRGPGSALYGTGAMFAVINIISRKGNAVDGVRASGELGSFGRRQGTLMYGQSWDNNSDLLVSGIIGDIKGEDLYYPEFDSPSTDNGVARNLDWDKYWGVSAKYSIENFAFRGFTSSRTKGIPTASYGIVFNDERAQTLDRMMYADMSYAFNFSNEKSLSVRTYVDHYGSHGMYPCDALVLNEAETDCNWAGAESKFRWDIGSDNRLTAGLEYRNNFRAYYHNWDTTTYFDGDFPYNVSSVYLQDEYQVSQNINLTLSVRHDEYTTVGSATTPRGGIVYNFMDKTATLKLLYGAGFRAPNCSESEYFDSSSHFKSNQGLQPEKIYTTELVWEQRLNDEWFGTVSLYHYDIKDLIDVTIDPADQMQEYKNLNAVRANGIEMEMNGRLKMGLELHGNYAYQEAVDNDTKEKLTNSPSHLVNLSLTYPFTSYFLAALEMQYQSERITVYQTAAKSFFLTNLNLVGRRLNDYIGCSLLIRNLFNVGYSLPAGYDNLQPAILQDGRSFIAKIELKY